MNENESSPLSASASVQARSMEERDQLFKANWGLVHFVLLRKFRVRDESLREDLIQEGAIGLWRATEDWDPAKGKISTYSYWWIWSRMRAFMDLHRSFWLPWTNPSRRPDKGVRVLSESSIHHPGAAEEEGSYMNTVACERAVRDLERTENLDVYRVLMERVAQYLPQRTVEILERRSRDKERLEDLAECFGVSRARIDQIEKKGLERARKEFEKMFRKDRREGWTVKERKDGVTELRPMRTEETHEALDTSWAWLPGKGLVTLTPAAAVGVA